MAEMVRFTVRIPEQVREKVARASAAIGVAPSVLYRTAASALAEEVLADQKHSNLLGGKGDSDS